MDETTNMGPFWCMTGCELTAPCKPMTCKKAGITEPQYMTPPDRPATAPDLDALGNSMDPDDNMLFSLHFQAKAAYRFAATGRSENAAKRSWEYFEKSFRQTRERITSLRESVAELRSDNAQLQYALEQSEKRFSEQEARAIAAEAALAKVRDALKPFADKADTYAAESDDMWICNFRLGDLRRARDALNGDKT